MAQSKLDFTDQVRVTKIQGEVQRVYYADANTGRFVVRVLLPKGGKSAPNYTKDGLITVRGVHPSIAEGMSLEFGGRFVMDPKYGWQFNADHSKEVIPSTKEGLITYLSSSFFHGIGPVKARKIVNRFGDDTLNVLNTQIERILEVAGITEANLASIKTGWEKNREINEVMQFLMDHGISPAFAGKIYDFYGNQCVDQIREDPYDLARNIAGVGFKKADALALSIGFAKDCPQRLKACIIYVLKASEVEGHCFLYRHQIMARVEEYIGFDLASNPIMLDMLVELESNGEMVVLRSTVDQERYYEPRLYRNESYCHLKMIKLAKARHDIDIDGEALYEHIRKNIGVELSQQQKESVIGMLHTGVSGLTGGPGTGKTQTTKAIVEALRLLDISFTLCAPTGRASKRMQEVIGHPATTIHRLLKWDKPNNGFAHNESNPLPTQCVLVDEFSMVDIHLAAALLRAIPSDAMVMFIGDPDQLPPVGAGNFLRDLIDSGVIKIFRLTEIFRQGAGSDIVKFSHEINRGQVPAIESPLMEPALWTNKNTDCLFIDSGFSDGATPRRDYPQWSSLRYGKDVVGMIEEVCKNTLPKYHLHPDDVQVLIPMKIGPIGTKEVNKRLQSVLNPPSSTLKEVKFGELTLRENDKVIQLTNNYDLGVFNGDIGRIIAIDEVNRLVHIRYDKDRVVPYTRLDLVDVDLAHAITVHKAQGSEFDFVIMPLMPQYSRMLYRQLIYTALTRAKKLAVFIGQRDSMKMAVETVNSLERQTSLRQLLTGELQPQVEASYRSR